jgi:hypothetical protein
VRVRDGRRECSGKGRFNSDCYPPTTSMGIVKPVELGNERWEDLVVQGTQVCFLKKDNLDMAVMSNMKDG